ncbi:hypothetical protein FA13DRAFT_724662 [Coprinellus micaceus]|uniref:Homeobox domain-containing protein n=1 Tax=Coprinellus micaceus TaxID=71717 RepID=A0A4Y7TVC8_COPMI|nr:hypothetical protein FA13DRAFT_724662 [Coprinellus micaceus]
MLENGVDYNLAPSEAKRLCEKIKKQTVYQAITPEKVRQWFYRRRREIKEIQDKERQTLAHSSQFSSWSSQSKPPSSGATGASVSQAFGNFGQWLAPKLTQVHIEALERMRSTTIDGRIEDALVRSLAQSWDLPKSVVDNYLREHSPAHIREPLTPVSPALPYRPSGTGGAPHKVDHRLPTPAETATSPSMSHAGDVFPSFDEPSHNDVVPSKVSDDMDVDPISSSSSQHPSTSPTDVLFRAIIQGVRGLVDEPPHPASARPSNAAEFQALWSPMPCLSEALAKIP